MNEKIKTASEQNFAELSVMEQMQKTALVSANDTPLMPETALASLDVDKNRLKQTMILQEIIETERGYVNDLSILVRCYLDPLNHIYLASVASAGGKAESASEIVQNTTFGNDNSSGWITFDQKQTLIRNSAALLRVQKLVLKMMEESLTGVPTDKAIAGLTTMFTNMMAKMESVYLPYCSQHDMALEVLAQIRKQHPNQLQQFLDEQRQQSNSRLEIQDYLIKPVQRICKYPLLLQELVKTIKDDDTELSRNLQQCLGQIKDLVSRINEKKKILENDRKRDLLLQRFTGNSAPQLQQIASAFDLKLADICNTDKKPALSSQSLLILSQKLQTMIRGSGLAVLTPLDVEKQQQSQPQNDTGLFRGVFLFKDIVLIVYPKKANNYHLIGYILLKDVESVEELDPKSAAISPLTEDSFHFGWKIVFKKTQSGLLFSKTEYLAYQFGAKTEKERQSWLKTFEELVPDKVKRLASLEESSSIHTQNSINIQSTPMSPNSDIPSTKRGGGKYSYSTPRPSEDDAGLFMDAGTSDLTNRMRMLNLQLQTDIKFVDVFIIENSVTSKTPAIRANTTPDGISSLSRAPSMHRPITAAVSHSPPFIENQPKSSMSLESTPVTSPTTDTSGIKQRASLQRASTESPYRRTDTETEENKPNEPQIKRANSLMKRFNINRVLSKSNHSLIEEKMQAQQSEQQHSTPILTADEKRKTISKNKLFKGFSKSKVEDNTEDLDESKGQAEARNVRASLDIDQALALGDEGASRIITHDDKEKNSSSSLSKTAAKSKRSDAMLARADSFVSPDASPLGKSRVESTSLVHDLGLEAFITFDNQIKLHNSDVSVKREQKAPPTNLLPTSLVTTGSPLRETNDNPQIESQPGTTVMTDVFYITSSSNRDYTSLVTTQSKGSLLSSPSRPDGDQGTTISSQPPSRTTQIQTTTEKSLKEVVEHLIDDVRNTDKSLRDVVDTFTLKSTTAGILDALDNFDTNLTINTNDFKILPRPPSSTNSPTPSVRHSVFRLKIKKHTAPRPSTESAMTDFDGDSNIQSPQSFYNSENGVGGFFALREASKPISVPVTPMPPMSPLPASSTTASFRRRRLSRPSVDEHNLSNVISEASRNPVSASASEQIHHHHPPQRQQ